MKKTLLNKSKIDSVIALFSSGQLEDALSQALKLTKTCPNHSLVHNVTGACYAGLGQLTSAIKSYEKAIELDPNYFKAYYNLGVSYQELVQYDKSIESYQKSISIDP